MVCLANTNQKTETIFLDEDFQVNQDGISFTAPFLLQDLAGGNQHVNKFLRGKF